MSVSIIIPAWNEAKTLRATTEALLAMDYDKKKCEVIIVAGGDDNTYKIARALSTAMDIFSRYVVIMQGPNGKNAAIQQGIEEAKGNIVVLLDADTLVSEGWLKNMVAPIEEGTCGLTLANPEPVRRNWVSDYYMTLKTYFLDRITTFSSGSIAFRASIIENHIEHFFDRHTGMGDDYLFQKRVAEQGQKTMFMRDARVKTHFPFLPESFPEIGAAMVDGVHQFDRGSLQNLGI